MSQHPPTLGGEQPRRGFLTKIVAIAVGSVIGLVPLVSAIAMLLDPLIHRRKTVLGADDHDFLKVAPASALDPSGAPRMFSVIADLQDAWNKFPQTEIGSVYLRQIGTDQVQCFTARCPHLGCTVDYKPDKRVYACPCHESAFALDGSPKNDIPPRPMDQLDAEIRDGDVWVKFQKFRAGIEQKEAV